MWMKKEKKNNNMKKDIILEKKYLLHVHSLYVLPESHLQHPQKLSQLHKNSLQSCNVSTNIDKTV